MAVFLRFFFLIPIAFALACFAAACVVVFALLRGLEPLPWPGQMIGIALATTLALGAITALPTLIAAIVAEMFGLRSPFWWLAFGGLLAAMGVFAPFATEYMHAMAVWLIVAAWMPDMQAAEGVAHVGFVTIALAAGFVGGFVYWLVAGRLAGYSDVTSRA
ncbi:hypothetical protein BH10PSE9_BH10PSE9_25580 [soil metagenome]